MAEPTPKSVASGRRGLAVLSREVGGLDRGPASQGGVAPMMVVEVEPSVKGSFALANSPRQAISGLATGIRRLLETSGDLMYAIESAAPFEPVAAEAWEEGLASIAPGVAWRSRDRGAGGAEGDGGSLSSR